MSYNFFVIGGDKRMFYLAQKLVNDGNSVKIFGFDKFDYEKLLNNNIKTVQSINDVEKDDILLSSVPLSMDGENIYAPYSSKKIELNVLKDKKIIAGKIPEYIDGFDILTDEYTTVLNSIPSAEGAIAKAINETNITLNDSNVLVLGYGRLGKSLCYRLKGMNANVYCEARNEKDLAMIETNGYKAINIKELNKKLCKMKIIFNTVPSLIMDKSRLILLKKETVIIDLASKPGGVDYETANKLGIKSILYLGIPGKVAPETSAEYMKRYVYKVVLQYQEQKMTK